MAESNVHGDLTILTLNLTLAGLPGPYLASETPSDLREALTFGCDLRRCAFLTAASTG